MKLLIGSGLIAILSIFSSLGHAATCTSFEEVTNPEDLNGIDRVIEVTGQLGFNGMVTEYINPDEKMKPGTDDYRMMKSMRRISVTLTPKATQVADPAFTGKTICLPKQFTLYLDDNQIKSFTKKATLKKSVTVKGIIAQTQDSVSIIDNGLLVEVKTVK